MIFDTLLLQKILAEYKKDFSGSWWKKEKYKWYAVKNFQDNWDIEAEDFAAMLRSSLSRTNNLLASDRYYPREMICELAVAAPEEVRSAFRNLYDENEVVVKRILAFKERAAQLKEKYRPEARLHYQQENAVTTYLWIRYPDKYYIYKAGLVKNVANCLHCEFHIKKGAYAENLENFYALYNEINEYVHQDKELVALFTSQLNDDCYPDSEYKTLTIDIGYYIARHADKGPDEKIVPQNSDNHEVRYWWLNANPVYWSYSELPVGGQENITLYNEAGNQRHIFKNFFEVKPGDSVIGYEASPVKQIVALCKIVKEQDGKNIWFEKTENLSNPIEYSKIKDCPELKNMESFPHLSGSLFRLKKDEYEFIMDLIREQNPPAEHPVEKKDVYDKNKFLSDVFMSGDQYDKLVAVLKNKKNIIFQGAPGVGKTFAARRLAWSIIGEQNNLRIQFVQFHQSYSYEDFVLGYKPSENGFELKNGIFYQFCQKASNEPDKDFFFIIDEINRGNMSKIFGELLMMIEKEYRGKNVTLAYEGRFFSVPKNLYIIGMMNTADRSLAMIDYALRRRFSFIELSPAFDTDGFKIYMNSLENETFSRLIGVVEELNEVIAGDNSLGKGFRIGHSYFCNWKKEECTNDKMRQVVDFDIIPVLEEYWFDDDKRVETWIEKLHKVFS